MGTRILIVVLFVLSVLTSSALTYLLISKTQPQGSSKNLGAEIEKFIQENPDVIISGLKKAQAARAQQEDNDAEKTAMQLRPQLEKTSSDPQVGNKNGDVTIVAFHDHNCGYCRKSISDIEQILTEDKKVRFVMKDFPILGPTSVDKAKASIAVAKIAPEKWYDYYTGLGHGNFQTAEQVIDFVQNKLGIDANLLKSEMESKETNNKIAENHALGEQLNINGTPVFVINGKVLRGAAGYEAFKAAIADARSGNKV